MNDKQHDDRSKNTFFEGILYEFTSKGIPIDDEVRARPRLGIPPGLIEERKREAARFLEEMNKESTPPKNDASNDASK
jgi:hypothetical protein